MSLRFWAQAAYGLSVILVTAPLCADLKTAPRTTAQWLVDLAREQALAARETQAQREIVQIEALLEAARRIDPNDVDVESWLYELHAMTGDETAAAENLARIVALDPGHETAFERWLEIGESESNTLEERETWLRKLLADPKLPRKSAALVHVHLGRTAMERLDRDVARRAIETALKLDSACPAAIRSQWELLPSDATAPARLRAALDLLRINPIDPEGLARVGGVLDFEGLDAEAGEFLEKAVELSERLMPTQPVSGTLLMALARNRYRRGMVEPAMAAGRDAARNDASAASEAGLFLWWALTDQGRGSEADDIRGQLAERFAAIREPDRWPLSEVAQAAWYYLMVDVQPVRAVGSSRVDLQACKLEYSIVSPK